MWEHQPLSYQHQRSHRRKNGKIKVHLDNLTLCQDPLRESTLQGEQQELLERNHQENQDREKEEEFKFRYKKHSHWKRRNGSMPMGYL
jgi:hypothetical protein